jgi:hypothetical protein
MGCSIITYQQGIALAAGLLNFNFWLLLAAGNPSLLTAMTLSAAPSLLLLPLLQQLVGASALAPAAGKKPHIVMHLAGTMQCQCVRVCARAADQSRVLFTRRRYAAAASPDSRRPLTSL